MKVSQPFVEAIAQVKTFVFQRFDQEIAEKHLCYHTHKHVEGVQHRASHIFQVIRPGLGSPEYSDRLELLLDLCAVAHDMIQVFMPQTEAYTSRRREAGVSEALTTETLSTYIHKLNQRINGKELADHFTEEDLRIIEEAIAATVCDYAPSEQAIFQPALSRHTSFISPVARILALADIGSLGMEGIEVYNTEGSLLFLEENPDVRSLIEHHKLENLASEHPELHENVRQRLLRRARFQVNFAKSRLKRFSQELEGFPTEAIPILAHEIFHYLTPETIETIEASTPVAEDVSLKELVNFFKFDQVIATLSDSGWKLPC